MKVFGLIGFPLLHSFSSQYFKDKFTTEGTNSTYRYKNFELNNISQFPELLRHEPELYGLNVTAPYKSEIIQYLDELVAPATDVNAVNTIKIFRDSNRGSISRLTGYNTDVIGFENSFKPLLKPHHSGALVLGDGGAAKAVKWVLNKLGLPFLIVTRRNNQDSLTFYELNADHLDQYPIIINTTPVGSFPNTYAYPELPYEYLTGKNLLFDLVYNPSTSLFLKKGKQHGATIKNGLEMLHIQAVESWKIWSE